MKNTLAPVAIFCFKRFDLLKNLLKSLKKNKLSKQTTVYFFADLNKNNIDQKEVEKVRMLIKKCDFFKKKIVILRNKNFGLKKNILDGISHVFIKHKKIIVLEDDLSVSKYFLKTINILLDKYKKVKNISTITGYSFQNTTIKNANIKENFFLLKRPSSWGWATWKNKWININGIKLGHQFDVKDYGNDLIIMNKKKNKGILNSWAYDWTIRHIKNDKFCIYPKFSMIKNYGFDSNATNNLFRDKKFYSKIKNSTFENYIYQSENKNIKNMSKLNYDINPLMFIVKLIYFTLFYEKSKK